MSMITPSNNKQNRNTHGIDLVVLFIYSVRTTFRKQKLCDKNIP